MTPHMFRRMNKQGFDRKYELTKGSWRFSGKFILAFFGKNKERLLVLIQLGCRLKTPLMKKGEEYLMCW